MSDCSQLTRPIYNAWLACRLDMSAGWSAGHWLIGRATTTTTTAYQNIFHRLYSCQNRARDTPTGHLLLHKILHHFGFSRARWRQLNIKRRCATSHRLSIYYLLRDKVSVTHMVTVNYCLLSIAEDVYDKCPHWHSETYLRLRENIQVFYYKFEEDENHFKGSIMLNNFSINKHFLIMSSKGGTFSLRHLLVDKVLKDL